jgi:hypothetical protein
MFMPEQTNSQTYGFPKLSQPALRALAAAGVQNLKQLSAYSEAEVRKWHGIGPNAMHALQVALAAEGLSFASKEKS